MKGAFWFMPLILVALGRQIGRSPRPFTATELLAWVPELESAPMARRACSVMQMRGMFMPAPDVAPPGMRRPTNPQTWQLTPVGVEACRAAKQEAAMAARAAKMREHYQQRPISSTLYGRLWNLLRVRQALTSEDAVGVLADAGDDTRSVQASIARYLHGWAKARPDAIQVSAKRVNGFFRYVLVQDIGARPPHALAKAEADQEASA